MPAAQESCSRTSRVNVAFIHCACTPAWAHAPLHQTPLALTSAALKLHLVFLHAVFRFAGGPITRRFFAPHPTVLQVGSTLFVHGGVLPEHVEYGLERINRETRDWLLGKPPGSSSSGGGSSSSSSSGKRLPPPEFLRGADAVVWARWVTHHPSTYAVTQYFLRVSLELLLC
jgi:hypothetical protein